MRTRMSIVAALVCLGGATRARGQQEAPAPALRPVGAPAAGQVPATPLAGAPVRLDGRLDDDAWRRARWVGGLTQREPVEGATPALRTEVAFVYDRDALYVGARMRGDSALGVRALVTRRDAESSSEQIIVSLDTWHDRRTAYSFGVTAAGVRLDYIQAKDRESSRDYSYDPVWQARTEVTADGWTAEMRIPFSQLRFNRCPATPRPAGVPVADDGPVGTTEAPASDTLASARCAWGVNVTRLIPARNEADYLVLVRRKETGWASRFADLVGIEDDRAPRRLEVLPYAMSEATLLGDPDPVDPFDRRRTTTSRTGADIKAGLGPNLTLDATVNPDFAQVEEDPAVVNLTAFETTLPEHRPFFVEGSNLLAANGPDWFYSRRIGQAPRLKAPGDYAEPVTSTTILGAAKVSGRLPSGLAIGVLGAVTGPEEARGFTRGTDSFGSATVEPRTGFGVVRLQQQLGRSGSTAGLVVTGVERAVSNIPALRARLPSSAYAGAVDWNLRSSGRTYLLSGAAGFSDIGGDSPAILRIQRSSAHYFQRPDARHSRLDSTRTALAGTYAGSTLEKIAGAWLWSVGGYALSPGLDVNDAGQMNAADKRGVTGGFSYRSTTPGRRLHYWEAGTESFQEWSYDGILQLDYLGAHVYTTWRSFWSANLTIGSEEPVLRADLTRGGPLMGRPRQWNVGIDLAGNPARKTRWSLFGSYDHDDAGGWGASAGAALAVRPGTRWALSATPSWSQGLDSRQYFAVASGGGAATYGQRYVFAVLQRDELSMQLRLSYALTPDLTLETYAEPFASAGRYRRYGELPAPRSYRLRTYGTDGTTLTRFGNDSIVVTDGPGRFVLTPADYTVLSFRSNVVLRWEWRSGSTAYLVWQQNRGGDEPTGAFVGPAALRDALSAAGENIVALKVSYWISP